MLSHFIHPAWAASARRLSSSFRCCSAASSSASFSQSCNTWTPRKSSRTPTSPCIVTCKLSMNVNPTCAASALKFSISSWYCCAAAPAEAALCALHPTPPTNRTFCQADLELKCCNYSILWQPSSCMKALLRLAWTSDSWSFSCCTWDWLG